MYTRKLLLVSLALNDKDPAGLCAYESNKIATRIILKSCNVKADILLARRRTDDISETQVPIKKIPFTFIDVGGQRTQREKWFQCFQDSINTILFFVAISEFDQTLVEDKRSNRVIESLKVF